jgi:hypothetical protein
MLGNDWCSTGVRTFRFLQRKLKEGVMMKESERGRRWNVQGLMVRDHLPDRVAFR